MTDDELRDLAEKARAATPGPWWREQRNSHTASVWAEETEPSNGECLSVANHLMPSDAAHIAAADPPTVLALVEELLRLRAEVADNPFRECVCDHAYERHSSEGGACDAAGCVCYGFLSAESTDAP